MMRNSERAQAISVLASAIPDSVGLDDGPLTVQFIVGIGVIAGYLPSDIDPLIDDIIERAREERGERADLRAQAEALNG